MSSASGTTFLNTTYRVNSDKVNYDDDHVKASYTYRSTLVEGTTVIPKEDTYVFKTCTTVPKTGLMLVGWGGNNGTTLTAGILANKLGMTWNTKEKEHKADYFGSVTQASTVRLGLDAAGESVYIPFKNMLPMVDPNDLVISGWDISGKDLAASMERAQVLDYDLQQKLLPHMKKMTPLPSIYAPHFIAANQSERADNVIRGSNQHKLETIRSDIRNFKEKNKLDKVIVLWTANTERFCDIADGLNTTSADLLNAIKADESEVSPSTIFAVASILEGCSYINGSPQNTFVPGCIKLAEEKQVFIAGDDFKSGQTKMKSVLVDYLVSAGIKPVSIVSYNHLGNNDGRNLSAPEQFRSKEISKSNVVDDMVDSNKLLYEEAEQPDHCVVIKYVPYVGDSKRAMDEYTSEIFMGGKNTIVMHNTCEDSLLATPLIIDLVVLCELCERISIKKADAPETAYERFHPVLSLLSYLLKAPLVPPGTPIVNALAAQRQALVNIFKACVGLPPEDYMLLEHRLATEISARRESHTGVAKVSGTKSDSPRTDTADGSDVSVDGDALPSMKKQRV